MYICEKVGLENGKQHSVLRKIGQFISIITSSRYLTGKKLKILHLAVETVLKEWPEQQQGPGNIIIEAKDTTAVVE